MMLLLLLSKSSLPCLLCSYQLDPVNTHPLSRGTFKVLSVEGAGETTGGAGGGVLSLGPVFLSDTCSTQCLQPCAVPGFSSTQWAAARSTLAWLASPDPPPPEALSKQSALSVNLLGLRLFNSARFSVVHGCAFSIKV